MSRVKDHFSSSPLITGEILADHISLEDKTLHFSVLLRFSFPAWRHETVIRGQTNFMNQSCQTMSLFIFHHSSLNRDILLTFERDNDDPNKILYETRPRS